MIRQSHRSESSAYSFKFGLLYDENPQSGVKYFLKI